MKIIFDYNRTIFNPDADNLYPRGFELLRRLSKKHELFLISRNEPKRKNRFERFNIENYFQNIMFVDKKTKQVFKQMIGNAQKIIVVGDSFSDEIKIGNQLGFITVRLRNGKFATEIPKNKDEVAMFEIADINELENIILSYENNNK